MAVVMVARGDGGAGCFFQDVDYSSVCARVCVCVLCVCVFCASSIIDARTHTLLCIAKKNSLHTL